MTNATGFLTILNSSLSPLVDRERTVTASFRSSRGFTSRPGSSSIVINFINLPPSRAKERRGGGAEAENNRMMFYVTGFDEGQDDPVEKVKVVLSVNAIPGAKGLKGKTASPDRIATYIAEHINETAGAIEPDLTHD